MSSRVWKVERVRDARRNKDTLKVVRRECEESSLHERGGLSAQIFKRDDGGASHKNEEIAVVAVDMESPQYVRCRTHKVYLIGLKMRDPRLPQ